MTYTIPATTLVRGEGATTVDIFAAFHTAMGQISAVARDLDWNDPTQYAQGKELFAALGQLHLIYMASSDLIFDAYSADDLVDVRS